eukprot:gene11328-13869_t
MSTTKTTKTTTTSTTGSNIPAGVKVVNPSQLPNFSKWTIIYPRYLNSEYTKQQGRKTSKEHSVKNPSCEEIAKAASTFGLNTIIEANKGYPKEFFQRGRVRVLLINESTKLPINSDIPDKTKLLIKISEKIKATQPNRPENFNPLQLLPPVQATSTKEKHEKKSTPQPSSSSGKKKNVNMV